LGEGKRGGGGKKSFPSRSRRYLDDRIFKGKHFLVREKKKGEKPPSTEKKKKLDCSPEKPIRKGRPAVCYKREKEKGDNSSRKREKNCCKKKEISKKKKKTKERKVPSKRKRQSFLKAERQLRFFPGGGGEKGNAPRAHGKNRKNGLSENPQIHPV